MNKNLNTDLQKSILQKYIEEAVSNCLICVLIFLLLHDIISSIFILGIQIILEQKILISSKSYTFLQNNTAMLASCSGDIVGIPFLVYWIKNNTKTKSSSLITFTKIVSSTDFKDCSNQNTNQKTKMICMMCTFVLVGICSSILLNGILILSGFTKFFVSDYEQTTSQLYGGTLTVTILFSGVIAPITEELLYRRILHEQMREEYGFCIACISSSLLFGVAHMAIVQGVYGFLTGIVLCYCYEVGKGVKTSILVHVTMNLTSIIVTQFLNVMSTNEQTLFFIVGGIVGVCVIAAFIMKTKSRWITFKNK